MNIIGTFFKLTNEALGDIRATKNVASDIVKVLAVSEGAVDQRIKVRSLCGKGMILNGWDLGEHAARKEVRSVRVMLKERRNLAYL